MTKIRHARDKAKPLSLFDIPHPKTPHPQSHTPRRSVKPLCICVRGHEVNATIHIDGLDICAPCIRETRIDLY